MRATVSALVAIACVVTLAGGAHGAQKSLTWLTFNEVGVDGKPRVLSRHDIFPEFSSVSPKHNQLAYVPYFYDGAHSNSLMVAEVGRARERLVVEAHNGIGGISDVAWAPNGHTIAFTADGIWLVDADGTNLRRVADWGAMLAWAPDSRQLAIARFDSRLRWVISVLSVETGDVRYVAAGQRPQWSPNGKLLLFEYVTARTEPPKVRVIPAAGGRPRTVARGAFPSWSPDGRRVAFIRSEDTRASLWVAPSRGGRPRRLASDAEDAVWSPDSHWIAFRQGTHYCGSKLAVVRVNGGRPRAVATHTRIVTPLGWSGNGRKVLYTGVRCSDQ